ncbi:hypothetical protein AU187_09040 [Mycobacterium sp. IS-1556]|nr:hypothetical protein AU187_09040 [Mycobacterium sp. IS-1556]
MRPPPKSVEDAAKEPEAEPDGKPSDTSDVGGTLEDLLNPEEAAPGKTGDREPSGLPPALSQQPPRSALDQILNQHAGNGKGDGQDGRYTKSPLTAPIVEADPSVVDRQAARVDAAREALDAAQAELDAGAGQTYSQGAGAGPGRDVTDPLSQAVFDARGELTEQTAILEELTQARSELGGQAVPIPPLPENADVQAFPPEPPVLERATGAFAEGMKDTSKTIWDLTMPDVGNMYDVATNWDEASGAERAQAIADAAGMAPIPGGKILGEGIEHGLDALGGASRHVDDVPTAHVDVDPPPTPHSHGDAPSGSHGPVDTSPAPHTHVETPTFDLTTDHALALGADPARGGSFVASEAETGLRIEHELGVNLSRAEAGASHDWVDASGRTYDAVGNFPSKFFDAQWSNLQDQIIRHADLKAEIVPVDVSRFTAAQQETVREFVRSLNNPNIIVIGGQ